MEEEPTPLPLAAPSCESSCPQPFTFDQDMVTDLQLKFIIKADLPFHIYDSHTFKDLVECLRPEAEFQKFGQTTVIRHASKLYSQARKDLIKYFENYQGKVSLTLHPWKTTGGYFNIPYTCITCHWIDPETWKMSKRIIGLEQFLEDLDEIVLSSISAFNLTGKVQSISVDDSDGFYTTTMRKLKREVNPMFNGVLFHTKCACRILNSMVKSSLDHVAPVIDKFESLCSYVFSSHYKEFRRFLREKGAKFRHIPLNIPYDWDTTYIMLDRMVEQKSLLVEYYASCDDKYSDIDYNDWEIMESLLGILKVFKSSVTRLSDAYYPTTPLVLGEILLIARMFKEYKQNVVWGPVIREMQSKLSKYYETMPQVFTCAAALDPRIGIGGVQNLLEDIIGYMGFDSDYATISMRKCCDALHEVFDYYDNMHRSRGREGDMVMESGSKNIIMESVSRKKPRTAISNELELYTKTDFSNVMSDDEYESFNMLEWWRNKGRHQYPILAEMALDMLTVQASTLALEFAFCLNGWVLDEETSYQMSKLSSPRLYEIRIFLKEHFVDKEGKRKVNAVEDDDDDDDDDDYDDDVDDDVVNDDDNYVDVGDDDCYDDEDVDLCSDGSYEE